MANDATDSIAEVVKVTGNLEDPLKRVFGVLGKKKIEIDPDWARPQEDLDAWIAGDV